MKVSALRSFRWWLAVWLATGAVLSAARVASVGARRGMSDVASSVLSLYHLFVQNIIYAFLFLASLGSGQDTARRGEAPKSEAQQAEADEVQRLREHVRICDRLVELKEERVQLCEAEIADLEKTASAVVCKLVREFGTATRAARTALDGINVSDARDSADLRHAKVLLDNCQDTLEQSKRALKLWHVYGGEGDGGREE